MFALCLGLGYGEGELEGARPMFNVIDTLDGNKVVGTYETYRDAHEATRLLEPEPSVPLEHSRICRLRYLIDRAN